MRVGRHGVYPRPGTRSGASRIALIFVEEGERERQDRGGRDVFEEDEIKRCREAEEEEGAGLRRREEVKTDRRGQVGQREIEIEMDGWMDR